MDFSALAVLFFFGAATLAFVTLSSYALERHETFRTLRRLRSIDVAAGDIRKRELSRPFIERVMLPSVKWAGRLGRRFTPLSVAERLNKDLAAAGSPVGWDAERMVAFKILASVAGIGGSLLLGPILGLAPLRAIVLAVVLGILGYYGPEWILRSRAGKRQKSIQRALPDALDLLSITVEAGLGFDAAVARVARQAGGPLGEELHRMLQEMQIGKARADALRDLAERSTIPEVKSFVLAMVQADIFGISIAKVLQVQAAEMRLKRRQRAEEAAQKVPVKIIFPLIFCIFPALFVVILGPAVIQVMESFSQR